MSLIATAAVINPEALKSSRRVLRFRNHLVCCLASGDQNHGPGPQDRIRYQTREFAADFELPP